MSASLAHRSALPLAAAAGAALLVTLLATGPSVQVVEQRGTTARVERGSFEVRVQAVGELQPLRATTISSEIKSDRGKIIFLAADGAQVEEGDVVVRFDPTPFEEERQAAELEVAQAETLVEARRQAHEWEKAQAERRVKTARFELEVAALDLHRLEKGEGPLELARLEQELSERRGDWEEQEGFLVELEALRERGHVNAAEVEQVQKRAAKAERAVELARRQLATYRDFILPSRVAALKHQVERADMELHQTEVASGFKVGEALAALRQAEKDLEAARADLAQARAELSHTVVRAPLPGMVVLREEFRDGERRKPRVGDSVWQSQPLLYLPDLSRMVVETQVREVDVHKVHAGDSATVRLDAYPDLHLPATVRSLGVLAEREGAERGGEKSFRVTVDLERGDPRLRPGMTARVDVLSRRVEDELVVPVQALWEEDGSTYCFVASADGFERREVDVGARSRHLAAVTEGLVEGDRVATVEPESWTEPAPREP